jgi:hypothetical protein
VDQLHLEAFEEGLCVQVMHIGPYATEPATVARMRAFAAAQGYEDRHERVERRGKLVIYDHHEIYLGNPRLAKPEKLRTVVRHPVKKVPQR